MNFPYDPPFDTTYFDELHHTQAHPESKLVELEVYGPDDDFADHLRDYAIWLTNLPDLDTLDPTLYTWWTDEPGDFTIPWIEHEASWMLARKLTWGDFTFWLAIFEVHHTETHEDTPDLYTAFIVTEKEEE